MAFFTVKENILPEGAEEAAFDFWVTILNIANWLLDGEWYQVMFALLGITGAYLTIRQLFLILKKKSILLHIIFGLIYLAATIFIILLITALIIQIINYSEY